MHALFDTGIGLLRNAEQLDAIAKLVSSTNIGQ
jgi:hypothetical protein